jgi:hypothetical protein
MNRLLPKIIILKNEAKLLFIFTLIFLKSLFCLAQQGTGQRNRIITYPDSIIKMAIWDKQVKSKLVDNYSYYWYYAGTINHNQGGFSGKLIHGNYEVFNIQQKLITQGNFEYGLKEGEWRYWYENGVLMKRCSYKNGQLNGKFKTYDSSGNLLADMNYVNNMLEGKCLYFSKDSLTIKKFRKGRDITKKEPRKLIFKSKLTKQTSDFKNKADKKPSKKSSFWILQSKKKLKSKVNEND